MMDNTPTTPSTPRLTVSIFTKGTHYSILNQDCQNKFLNIDPSANPEHVIIPILGSIFLFPILVITTICCIRVRNIRAREKRIDDLAKKNRISKGRVHNMHIYAHLNFSCYISGSNESKPMVRFLLPDLDLKSVLEEPEARTTDDTEDIWERRRDLSDCTATNSRKKKHKKKRKINSESQDIIRKEEVFVFHLT